MANRLTLAVYAGNLPFVGFYDRCKIKTRDATVCIEFVSLSQALIYGHFEVLFIHDVEGDLLDAFAADNLGIKIVLRLKRGFSCGQQHLGLSGSSNTGESYENPFKQVILRFLPLSSGVICRLYFRRHKTMSFQPQICLSIRAAPTLRRVQRKSYL